MKNTVIYSTDIDNMFELIGEGEYIDVMVFKILLRIMKSGVNNIQLNVFAKYKILLLQKMETCKNSLLIFSEMYECR